MLTRDPGFGLDPFGQGVASPEVVALRLAPWSHPRLRQPDLALEDLPSRPFGQRVHDLHGARIFVRGDLVLDEGTQFVGSGCGVRFECDHSGDLFAEFGMRYTDDCRFRDGGVFVEDFLDLARVDVVAAADDHLLLAVDDVALPGGLPALPTGTLLDLDDAVRKLLRNDETLPLSLLIALLLNNLATQVNPAATGGAFLSPFARLSFEEKAQAFQRLEEPTADLVAAIDGELPEPLRGMASGMLQFVAGALLEFSAFGTFCEWSKFDPASRYVTGTPVGWRLSGYDPGGMDGWDEFRGYYQGREKVSSR